MWRSPIRSHRAPIEPAVAWYLRSVGAAAPIVGIYGVVAHAVAQRTQEIGLRIALGAPRGQVVAMVVRQGMAITLGGIALGLAAAMVFTQVMTALLYEVAPTDLATFAAAVATVGATALAACCGPAVKASLIDPLVALRCE